MKKLAILVVGRSNAGKTSVWKDIARITHLKVLRNGIRGINPFTDFPELKLEVFIQGQSPTELNESLKDILGDFALPKILLCSEQTTRIGGDIGQTRLVETISYLKKNKYDIKLFWIKEGHGPKNSKKTEIETLDGANSIEKRLGYLPDAYKYSDKPMRDEIRKHLSDYIKSSI